MVDVWIQFVFSPSWILQSKGVRRLGGKGGLSGKQQLFELKSFRASTAGEIPPDNIIIEGQIPLEALPLA